MLDKPHRENHHQTTLPSEHDMKTTCQSLPGILNGRVETTTLRFRSLDAIPTTHPLAFIVTDVNRQSYLVGLHEPPYPIVRSTQTTGTPSGDPAVISYEVTFTALKALIPLG